MLFVAHTYRYYPAIQRVMKLIRENRIGAIRFFSSITGNDADPRYPLWRPALWEMGLHRVDLARYFMGEVEFIDADFLGSRAISIRLGTAEGSATLTIVASPIREDILVVGELAYVWIPSLALDVAVLIPHGSGSYTSQTITVSLRQSLGYARCLASSGLRHVLLGTRAVAHYSCLRDFANSILTRQPSAVVSDEDALAAVSCLEKVSQILDSKSKA
jgi:predicted dehydrogenase